MHHDTLKMFDILLFNRLISEHLVTYNALINHNVRCLGCDKNDELDVMFQYISAKYKTGSVIGE